ncbi:hypothetical protein Q1695_007519 [Nippostrongylus brasiliensis]|nr:hypothetical protein Q1695_007519 [Nippostrongylus brasiliensis]
MMDSLPPTIEQLRNTTTRSQHLSYCEEILLTLFLSSAAYLNIVFIIYQVYQVTLSFIAVHPCEVFLSREFYMPMNILFGFGLELYLVSLAAITLERVLATIYVTSYEYLRSYIGAIGVVGALLFATASQIWLYHGKKFTEPQISVLSPPSEVYGQINGLLLFNVGCSLLNTTVMIALLLINKRQEKNMVGDLSCRFQTEENIDTTKIIAKISVMQLLSYTSQSLGSLLLRLFEQNFEYEVSRSKAVRTTVKLALYGMPVFTLLTSIVIEYSIRSTATVRRNRLRSAVSLKNETQKYAQFLDNQWNKK